MQQIATLRQVSEELAQDHERLHELIDQLGRAGDLAQLSGYLATLHERLAAHFVAEEKPGGLYDALGVCAPAFRRTLGQLVDDHFRLAATLRDLRDRAGAAGGGDADALRADVARLVGALAEHEKRELEMVRSAAAPRT